MHLDNTDQREAAATQASGGRTREGPPGDPKDQRVQHWAGLGASPGKRGGVGWVRPGPLLPFRPPQSTSVLARKPIAYLSCRPRLWAGGWGGSGSGTRTPSIISSRWGTSQGGVICLPCHGGGTPSPGPRPLGREGILRKEGPQEQPLPSAPTDTPQSESHACPCI